jgi:hypothetical protein
MTFSARAERNKLPILGMLRRVNANVHSLRRPDGSQVGNITTGGGPLTDRHNTVFSAPDAVQVSAKLGLMSRCSPRTIGHCTQPPISDFSQPGWLSASWPDRPA